jgi:pyridoxamine 5'-phosphate oxidase
VLMKLADERGFCFYTNAESQKGSELLANPHAAMCFHWKSLRRQVRIEGTIQVLPDEAAEEYFHSRGRRSQLGATVSQQSRPLESRSVLEAMVKERDAEYAGQEIPRPDYWKGYILKPKRIEFWQDGANRLHDRIVFTQGEAGWSKTRLFP